MAQDDKKMKPILPSNGNSPKKTPPKFSVYWIYALIIIFLLGYQLLNLGTADTKNVSELEFRQNMLLQGDVA